MKDSLHPIDLPPGKVIFEANTDHAAIYFPRDGLVSLLYVLKSGDTSEIAMVGSEGVVGVALAVDSQSTPSSAVVQIACKALMLKSEDVEREFARGGAFQMALLKYMQVLIIQMAQTGVCNRHHVVEQQLCKWLLLCSDRVGIPAIRMTQEQIASLLGVRREGVAEAARRLHDAGIISYSRGIIAILNRPALLKKSCECYGVVRDAQERILRIR